MKRLMLLVIGLVLLAGMVSIAQAATTADISVKVTVTAVLAVSVDRSEYNFGSHSVGVTTISTQAITVTNDSSETTQSYKLNAADSTDWTLGGAPGEDTFELRAIFYGASDTDSPVEADFETSNDDLTTGVVYCSITQFAEDGGTEGDMGINVATTAPRYLWFLLKTPTTLTTGGGDEQTSTVTVTAAYPE